MLGKIKQNFVGLYRFCKALSSQAVPNEPDVPKKNYDGMLKQPTAELMPTDPVFCPKCHILVTHVFRKDGNTTIVWTFVWANYDTPPADAQRNAVISVGLIDFANAAAGTIWIQDIGSFVVAAASIFNAVDLNVTGVKYSKDGVTGVQTAPLFIHEAGGSYAYVVIKIVANNANNLQGTYRIVCQGLG